MIVNKAYRYRLYPTREQKMMFAKTFGCVRFIYNKMLSDRLDYYQETGKKLNNTPAQYKEDFPWLKEVDSLALANAQMNKWYPSSQLCHACGYQNHETKDLSVREWDCPKCGSHHNRDKNAAINIREEARRISA
ncbi:helix-turn-helix domain-containing protein [Megasphaera elsdenii]|uniref:helix-turn-helix domain-containing protein n=1 Tax=Megasphaera elsdenii TaxID=907 RepID=UPI001475A001|nr:helix-turn-helix domain-containing protein [Megasphaera elsdenii]NME18307.1 helix-turn-helix domain-containing protein [Megasphaera elsdenii]